MTSPTQKAPPLSTQHPAAVFAFLQQVFSKEEHKQVVVLVVDQDWRILDYRHQHLDDIKITLAKNSSGDKEGNQ